MPKDPSPICRSTSTSVRLYFAPAWTRRARARRRVGAGFERRGVANGDARVVVVFIILLVFRISSAPTSVPSDAARAVSRVRDDGRSFARARRHVCARPKRRRERERRRTSSRLARALDHSDPRDVENASLSPRIFPPIPINAGQVLNPEP
jgi:hypothetical protein